jgi:Zn-dependent protease with chaperone function
MFFIRRNQFSQNREVKFFARPVERMVGRAISSRLLQSNKSHIYKQDTEEVRLVKSALAKLIKANNLQDRFGLTNEGEPKFDVTLIHSDTFVMFINLDQRFFLTIPLLKLSNMNEESLALLVAHELAHYLLEH